MSAPEELRHSPIAITAGTVPLPVCTRADIVVSCDRPRIGPHRKEIRESLARILGLAPSHINIKGKTTEGLDLPWIEASAVVLLRDA